MLLVETIKGILKKMNTVEPRFIMDPESSRTVLNVGGGNKNIPISEHFQNWRHLLLDIDPGGGADIVMDARKLSNLPKEQFDAIYCSHNLEHYFKHEVASVLSGFYHVLKPDGFAEIYVPHMRNVLKHFIDTGMEIDDVLYTTSNGPITVLDVIYGCGKQIEVTGADFYAHKTGFTETSLKTVLKCAGFAHVWTSETTDTFAIGALAFKQNPTPSQFSLLGLSAA